MFKSWNIGGFMKSFVLTMVLFFSSLSYAVPKLKCITGGLPTTSFILSESAEKTELLVVNHNGARYAPVYSGIATPNDVDLINKSGEFFKKIGDRFTLKFDKERCRIEEDKFYTCSLREASDVNGVKIEKAYFTTSESIDKIPDFEFVRTNVRLYLTHDHDEYKLEMSYYNDDCQIIKELL